MTPKVKIEALETAPAGLAESVAKKVNEGFTASQAETKKKLLSVMGKGDADTKLVKESATKDAAADLKSFKEKILDKPEVAATEIIRADIHDKIIALLGGEFKAGTPEEKYTLEDMDKYKAKFKKPEAEAKTKADATPEVEPQITTADQSVYTGRQVLKTGAVVGGALTAGSLVAGASQAAFGASALPWYARGISGFTNFWKGAWDIAWHKGVGNIVTNGIWNPLNTLAAKLGVTTGASANTAALAGLPAWMAPVGVGLGVAGGAYAGSKVVNWLGKKVGVKPTT
ncbi:MAG TPA: hypothetical protein PKV72_04730, partial [Candidatus Peribacteria bacterium]|nr:hypothetical protein [Candidatus Peribacteria bacterium]